MSFLNKSFFRLTVLFTGLGICTLLAYTFFFLPDAKSLLEDDMQVPMRIYSKNGDLIAEYGTKHRLPLSSDEIPTLMKQAIIAAEDHRFYQHYGVDFISIARAVKELLVTGQKSQGASTITMQVARNFFLSREKTYARKINEILLAFKIEMLLSKDKILELYLNKIFLGHRAYGVQAAARNYYGKDIVALNVAQYAMLAGLPKAPSTNNPIANPQKALARRGYVLQKMLQLGFIDTQIYTQAMQASITEKYHGVKIAVHAPYVAEMVRQDLLSVLGESAYTMGLSVVTTVDATLQNAAKNSITTGLLQYDKRHGLRSASYRIPEDSTSWLEALKKVPHIASHAPAAVMAIQPDMVTVLLEDGTLTTLAEKQVAWATKDQKDLSVEIHVGDIVLLEQKASEWLLSQNPDTEASLVSLDPNTGAILALVGGYHFFESNFNRAVQAKRQMGSLFKPFLYSAALDSGFTLASLINDAPVVMQDSGEHALWRPNNVNYRFYGPTSLREALTKSRNVVSIRLLDSVGIQTAKRYIAGFGFSGEDAMPSALSLALGSGVSTPLQAASAYSVFASQGMQHHPYLIEKIMLQNGKQFVLPGSKYSKKGLSRRVITEENAYLIHNVLQDVIKKGTARRALVLKRSDIAGKTGTTNDQRDAWFCGYTPDIVTAVWVGFDNAAPLHEYASQLALPLWIDYMKIALMQYAPRQVLPPSGVVYARVDPKTGYLASAQSAHSRFEIFDAKHLPEQSPTVDFTEAQTEHTNTQALFD